MKRSWAHARRLLGVRLDTLGDVLMTGPAVRALREAGAGRRVTLLTSASGAAMAELMPEIDEAIVYEAPWIKASEGRTGPAADAAMVERLRACRFDAAVIFTVYSQSPLPAAVLCHLAGVPLRLAHCRENPYGLLTDWVAEREPEHLVRHEVRRQLDLVKAVGATTANERLAVAVPAIARDRVRALLASERVGHDRRWAVLHPGGTAASRRWPARSWAEVADRLAREHGLEPVFTGDASEVDLVAAIRAQAGAPGPSLAGRLDLGELAALLVEAPVLVAGNTGPVHLAAAVGTPVVDLYALTNPQHAPWQVPSRILFEDVPCRWCYRSVCPEGHHRCLRGVAPSEVVEAAVSVLRGETRSAAVLPPVEGRTPRSRAEPPPGATA